MQTKSAGSSGLPVLCLDDDAHFGRALVGTIRDRRVDWVERDAHARQRILARRYAAWFLDVRLPDGSGLGVLEWARARGDRTPAVVMTGVIDDRLANQAQRIGAELLFKPFGKDNVDAFLARCDARHEPESARAWADAFATRHGVSERERQIVHAIVSGVSRMGLAEVLGVSENTVKTTVRTLLRKTRHASLDELLRESLRDRVGRERR